MKIPQIARLACCALLAGLVTVSPAAETERLRASLEFLASDALEGRGVGTAGIQKAASYLEEQFAEFGLGVRTQEFEVSLGVEVGENNSLVIVEPDGGHEEVQLEVGNNSRPWQLAAVVKWPVNLSSLAMASVRGRRVSMSTMVWM